MVSLGRGGGGHLVRVPLGGRGDRPLGGLWFASSSPSGLLQEVAYRCATALGMFWAVNGTADLFLLVWIVLNGIEVEEMLCLPYLATSLGDFWGKRWNVLMSKLFKEMVYVPMGGKDNPIKATIASFSAAALFHEYVLFVSGLPCGKHAVFFGVMGLATVVSSQTGRLIAATADPTAMPIAVALAVPIVSWALTMGFLLLFAPVFYDPYIRGHFFEQVVGALPFHSVEDYPLPLMICQAH